MPHVPSSAAFRLERLGRLLCALLFLQVIHVPAEAAAGDLVAPIVSIEDLLSDGKRYAASENMRLPKGTHNLRIDYTTAAVTDSEHARFRYRLAGVDDGWQDVGQRRQAYYTNLGPGRYVFMVTAAGKDGVWSARYALLTFVVEPVFYQTLLFKAGVGAAAILFLRLLFALRLDQIHKRYRRGIDARLAERERIARDVHDTLLLGVQALLFRLQMWEDEPSVPDSVRKEMATVIEQTRTIVAEGRQRILMMRRTDAQPVDLVETLAGIGNEASVGKSAVFEVNVVGDGKALTIETKDQLIDIAREGVRNAYQHADADRITVEIEYGSRSVTLTIEDDGRGIDASVFEKGAKSSHFGLTGMRERAKQLGGRFRLKSKPGLGTRIEVVLPGAVAFSEKSWWPWQHSGPLLRAAAHSQRSFRNPGSRETLRV